MLCSVVNNFIFFNVGYLLDRPRERSEVFVDDEAEA
jgi:hypothetical protein